MTEVKIAARPSLAAQACSFGLVGGVAGRYTASTWALSASYESALVLLGTAPTWLLAAWWMTVAE